MKREKFTVQPSRQGGWDLQDSGGGKTPFNTKTDAVAPAATSNSSICGQVKFPQRE